FINNNNNNKKKGASCDDDLFCTMNDTCQPTGECTGTPRCQNETICKQCCNEELDVCLCPDDTSCDDQLWYLFVYLLIHFLIYLVMPVYLYLFMFSSILLKRCTGDDFCSSGLCAHNNVPICSGICNDQCNELGMY